MITAVVNAVIYALALVPCMAQPIGERTLVVVDANSPVIDVSTVTDLFDSRGHAVTVKAIKDGPELYQLGQRQFDNLLIVPGKTKGLGKNLATRELLSFLDDGGNIVALTTPGASPLALRETAAQLGIKVAPRGVSLIDHFTHELDDDAFPHSTIVKSAHVRLDNCSVATIQDNPIALGVVAVPFTSYSVNGLEESGEPFTQGDGYLAAVAQTRGNARFAWVGSAHLLTGDTGKDITSWAFQERDVVRVKNTHHHDAKGVQHHVYKISEDITYCAELEQWNGNSWVPFVPTDAQVDFRMLDPYYRVNLEPNGNELCRTFKIPDQYGMFTFDLEYTRRGLSFLKDENTVTIRHTANDEWPRSWTITNSWVYLSSALAVMAAWLLFIGLYLA